MKKLSA